MRQPINHWLTATSVVIAVAWAPSAPALASAGARSGVQVAADVRPLDGSTPGARILLQLAGVRDPQGATIHYTLDGPGRIVRQDAAHLPPGPSSTREVVVAFDPMQRVYLNVFTQQGGRGGVMAIPLGAPPAPQTAKPEPGGEPPLVVLPAQTRPAGTVPSR